MTVVARPNSARWRRLTRNQAIVDVQGERAAVRVADALDEETPYDLVIVTVLAHQLDAVLPVLKRSAASSILFMFNTFNPECLREAVGEGRFALGVPFVQATLTDDGQLKSTIGAGGRIAAERATLGGSVHRREAARRAGAEHIAVAAVPRADVRRV